MLEYKITRQAVATDWAAVDGAAASEMDLHTPAGEDWSLHSFEYGPAQVIAVWAREKRLHQMSEIYSHASSSAQVEPGPVKTTADIPKP